MIQLKKESSRKRAGASLYRKLFMSAFVFVFVFGITTDFVFADYTIVTGPTGTPTQNNGWGRVAPAYEKSAQSFTTVGAGTISSITQASLMKTGTISDFVTVSIQADSGGSPSGTPLQTSSNVTVTATSCTDSSISFASPASLAPTTVYWVVFDRTGSLDSSNYFSNCDASGYSGGNKKLYASGAWTNFPSDDEVMTINVTETPVAPSVATSTIDQVQQNIFNGFVLFFLGIGTMYLLFRHKE